MFNSLQEPNKLERDELFSMANELSGYDFFRKKYPYNFKAKVKHLIRMISLKAGVYDALKKTYVRITKKY